MLRKALDRPVQALEGFGWRRGALEGFWERLAEALEDFQKALETPWKTLACIVGRRCKSRGGGRKALK